MTCIVGLVHEEKVYIGGDSAGVAGYSITVRSDQKVFTNGDFLMGFTSSFRMGQLLRYSFSPPKRHPDTDVMKYMVTEFITSLRQCFKDGGYARRESDEESGGCFLVGYQGRLFGIESDYQVGEAIGDYMAVGCGYDIALGAMYANREAEPERRVTTALQAAAEHSAGVCGPFIVQSV